MLILFDFDDLSEFFYSRNSISRLDEIIYEIQIFNENNKKVIVPLERLTNVLPDPFFPNSKFEFDLQTLLGGKVNNSFGFRYFGLSFENTLNILKK